MNFIAIDFETANHLRSSACQVGLAKVENGTVVETRSFYIRPIPDYYETMNIRIHGIRPEQTQDAPSFETLWRETMASYLEGYRRIMR